MVQWGLLSLVLVCISLLPTTSADHERDPRRTCDEAVSRLRCHTRVICEGDRSVLTCAVGVIQVISASFGRTDRRLCSRGHLRSELSNTNCAFNVLAPVSQSCNGHQSCVLFATTAIFTDPCPGTAKYLTVSYYCLPSTAVLSATA